MKTKFKKPIKKIMLIVLVAIGALAGTAFFVFFSGLLVKPTETGLAQMKEVPSYDILQWQHDREQEILNDYSSGVYTLENPYVIVDPYEMNPCSALVIFEKKELSDVSVTVTGDDAYATYSYTVVDAGSHCEIPVIGLYAGRTNSVILQSGGETAQLSIRTEPLPDGFQTYKPEKSDPEKMEPGITLMVSCFEQTYTALIDHNAAVRGYLSNKKMGHGTSMILLKNGNMMSTGDEYKQVPYNMTSLWEFNWLGKIFKEYEIPNAVHHNIRELSNGDILAASNSADMQTSGTREDMAIVIDRQSGEVKKQYNFKEILDETRRPFNNFDLNIKNQPVTDWMHLNAVDYDPETNSIIASSPIQSEVVCIDADTSKINWILGPHEGYEGSSAYLKQYLLTPEGENFEWQWGQHDPEILPDEDNNPDTLDILLLDNGQARSFYKDSAVPPAENYSRGVVYRIHLKEKTVEQLWHYGEKRGSECYATFLGSTKYMPETGNRLVDFGGQLRVNGVATDDIINGVFGTTVTNSRIVETTESGEVVFEVTAHENQYNSSAETYQAARIPLFSAKSFSYTLGQIKGQRLGKSYFCMQNPSVQEPRIFAGDIGVSFGDLHTENDRLVADGNLVYKGKAYLLSKAYLVFASKSDTYVYDVQNSLNGRFFASINLGELKSGVYQISVIGAVREGNDTQSGQMFLGNIKTGYKITVE